MHQASLTKMTVSRMVRSTSRLAWPDFERQQLNQNAGWRWRKSKQQQSQYMDFNQFPSSSDASSSGISVRRTSKPQIGLQWCQLTHPKPSSAEIPSWRCKGTWDSFHLGQDAVERTFGKSAVRPSLSGNKPYTLGTFVKPAGSHASRRAKSTHLQAAHMLLATK